MGNFGAPCSIREQSTAFDGNRRITFHPCQHWLHPLAAFKANRRIAFRLTPSQIQRVEFLDRHRAFATRNVRTARDGEPNLELRVAARYMIHHQRDRKRLRTVAALRPCDAPRGERVVLAQFCRTVNCLPVNGEALVARSRNRHRHKGLARRTKGRRIVERHARIAAPRESANLQPAVVGETRSTRLQSNAIECDRLLGIEASDRLAHCGVVGRRENHVVAVGAIYHEFTAIFDLDRGAGAVFHHGTCCDCERDAARHINGVEHQVRGAGVPHGIRLQSTAFDGYRRIIRGTRHHRLRPLAALESNRRRAFGPFISPFERQAVALNNLHGCLAAHHVRTSRRLDSHRKRTILSRDVCGVERNRERLRTVAGFIP